MTASTFDEGPSRLYDALSKVLGLDALVDAQTALQQARSARDKARKEADQERQALLARLDGESDERAARAKEALGQKDGGLKEVEALLAGEATSREETAPSSTSGASPSSKLPTPKRSPRPSRP